MAMSPQDKIAAAKALCIRRGLVADETVVLHNVKFERWELLLEEIQRHIDLVYIVEGRQL
jgi:hypothetical protein